MSGHTPGPWMAEGPSKPSPDAPLGGDYAILDGGTNIIAETFRQVSVDSVRPAAANARLISAAPDLLEACSLLLEQYDASGDFTMGGKLTNEPFTLARAAIAKATGSVA